MKKISVIIPVYNVECYLRRCVESILNQSYKNIEIILVDDGSTDSSGRICDDYSQKYDNVIVIHKKNGGLSSARNFGLDIYKGDYVSFIDSDDWIEKDMYRDMLKTAEYCSSDIVICRRFRVDEYNNKTLDEYMKYPQNTVMNRKEALGCLLSFRGFDMSVCDKIFSRNVIDNIRFPIGKTCEDSFTTYKYFAKASKISYIDKPFYNYFYRLNSITRNSVINKTVIEAALEQKKYINQHFPDLRYEANTNHICAYLSVYNSHLQRSVKCTEMKEYQKKVRSMIISGLANRNSSLKKKIQMVLFICCPFIYNRFTIRKLEKV